MKKISDNQELVDFLANYRFEIIDMIKAIRKIIYKRYESIDERVNLVSKSIEYNHERAGHIITIHPFNDYVKMAFEHGNLIVDRYRVFDRSSKEEIKYIKIKTIKDVNEDIILDYVGQSVLVKKK